MYDCRQGATETKGASVTVSYIDDGNKSWTDDWAVKPTMQTLKAANTRITVEAKCWGSIKHVERIWYV